MKSRLSRRPFYARSFTVFPADGPMISVTMQHRVRGIVAASTSNGVEILVNRLRFDAATGQGSRFAAARSLLDASRSGAQQALLPSEPRLLVRPGDWTFKNPSGGHSHPLFGHHSIAGKFSVSVRLTVDDHQRFEGKPGIHIRFNTDALCIHIKSTVAAWREYRQIAAGLGMRGDFATACLFINRRLQLGLETQPEGWETRGQLKREFSNSHTRAVDRLLRRRSAHQCQRVP